MHACVEFVDLEEFSVPKTVVTLAIAMALFTYAVYRERRSVKLARELADSLINSGWYKRYSSIRPHKRSQSDVMRAFPSLNLGVHV